MTNESFSAPSELSATSHGIAIVTRFSCSRRREARFQRGGLLGVLRCEGEKWLRPANSGRVLPGSQGTADCPVSLQESAREKGLAIGESLTTEKMKECYWITPKLVCLVAFLEWTDAGHLRHCAFIAVPDDKKPLEVVRET